MADDVANSMSEGEGEAEQPRELSFHYIKSNTFRVIHADGALGGVTPRGHVHMALYSERGPIPLVVTHRLSPEGKLEDETGRVSREGVVREVEVDVVLAPEVAISVANWLLERAHAANEARTSSHESSK